MTNSSTAINPHATQPTSLVALGKSLWLRLLEVCGLYRQTWQGTFSPWLATIINKI